MPAPRVHAFALAPHPATPHPPLRAVTGRLAPVPGGWLVTYVLEGDLDRVRIPQAGPSRFADDLWRHTCCEAFVAPRGGPRYVEFNFAPSGEWAVYRFERRRDRLPFDAGFEHDALNPHITVCRSPGKLELDAVLRLDRLVPDHADSRLALGLAAVIEESDGALSYWALRHPGAEPDFHHPEAFALELEPVRD